MSGSELRELLDDGALLFALTVDQYHQMIKKGIVAEGEPYELLHGCLVRKDRSAIGEDAARVGTHHAWAVITLQRIGRVLDARRCHMQTQQPIPIPPHHEPEPDGAIIMGTEDDYRHRHPSPDDVRCVIEVAEGSLARDRTAKLRIYAQAGIEQYVIINLVDRVCEVHTQPLAEQGRYGHSETLMPGKSVEFRTASSKPLSVPVRRLLP